MKRIFLFIATNIAVLVVIRVVLAILGINSTDQVGSLLAYSAVVGFSGSIVSLLMSKTIAKLRSAPSSSTSPKAKKKLGCWQLLKRKPANGI